MPKAPKANIPGRQKPIHPQSRKAAQLARQANHEQRVHRAHGDQATKLEVLGNKLLWFKENVDLQKTVYSKLELCLLVEEYLHRFDEEMEQIELIKNSLKTRQGGQHMSRETAIKTTLERDRREYEEMGIEVPDILNGKRLKYFKEWNGELRYIQNIKMRKISAKDKEQCESKASQMDVRDKRVELGETDVKSKTESLEDETKTENVVGQQVLSQVMETG